MNNTDVVVDVFHCFIVIHCILKCCCSCARKLCDFLKMLFYSCITDLNTKRREGDGQLRRRPKLKSIFTVTVLSFYFSLYFRCRRLLSDPHCCVPCVALLSDLMTYSTIDEQMINRLVILKASTPGKVLKRKLISVLHNLDQISPQVSQPTKEFAWMGSGGKIQNKSIKNPAGKLNLYFGGLLLFRHQETEVNV